MCEVGIDEGGRDPDFGEAQEDTHVLRPGGGSLRQFALQRFSTCMFSHTYIDSCLSVILKQAGNC